MSEARRILIVEDDDDVRQLLTDLLAAEGYEVRGATNGADALALVAGWWPDLVLLEPRLPASDHRAVHAKLSAAGGPNRTAAPLLDGSLRLECSAVLTRPFDVGALMAALETVPTAE